MTKCTPEEARGLAEQSDWCFCGYCQNIAPLHRIARLVNLAREPMAARLEVLEREHTEFFDRWHDERRKREAMELERDEARQAETIALANAAGLCRWKEKILKAADETFAGDDAPRFKLSLKKNGTAINVFPKELDGAWVAFQRAEDDAHIGMLALFEMQGEQIAELRMERDALAAQVKELREALIYHQEQTRPICRTREALARTAPAAARDPRGD